ncbi:MAG: TonB-dependent receptor plug domain-containing protein, partial [Rhizorhabdus sp.]
MAQSGLKSDGTAITDRKEQPGDGLQTIIVTARRREEELQVAPVSVMALSASDLEARSFTHLRALQNFVPNVTFAASAAVGESAGNAFIRGIGQEDFLAGAEPGVGVYLDGVYLGRTLGTLTNLLDLQRIEVLRGPQGTLYGRNAIGGAINLISAQPGPSREGSFGLIAGNLGRREARAMINAPITTTLFLRLAAGRTERDGYLKRLPAPVPPGPLVETDHRAEGRDGTWTVRLQARWLPSDSLTVDFAADASRRRGTQSATHVDAIEPFFGIFPNVNGLIRAGALPGQVLGSSSVTPDPLASYAGGGNFAAQDIEGVAGTLRKEFGRHTLRLTAAYRALRSDVFTDLDGLYLNILENR